MSRLNQVGWGCERTCSECGKVFYIERPTLYIYHFTYQNDYLWQCDYNCYNHACLRSRHKVDKYITKENYIKFVKSSEEIMIHKGKQILHPIDLSVLDNEKS